MAVNVNTVYQTVLLILNKEQRGYMTPTEFNNVATQVQLEIFEKYFEDLNQQVRVPQTNTDYANRPENIDEKMSIFRTSGNCNYNISGRFFNLPTVDFSGNTISSTQNSPDESGFYMLGNVVLNNETEFQRVDRTTFYYTNKSGLTKPSKYFPIYLLESNRIFVRPADITSNVSVDFIRKPKSVVWGFNPGTLGQYVWNKTTYSTSNPTGSISFELHESEQTDIVMKILLYAGIIIRDPQIVQAAASQVQAEEVNEKS